MIYYFDIDRDLLAKNEPCINIRSEKGKRYQAVNVKFGEGLLTFGDRQKDFGVTCWIETDKPFTVQFVKDGVWKELNL